MALNIFIFIISFAMLFISGRLIVASVARIARYLGWREFVAAFIVIAFATSLPNLFVGITSALKGIPELSFGDILGGNMVDLTVAVALAALFAKGLPANSKMVQTSALFSMIVAVAPLLLILDGSLGRGDGVVLILLFCFYMFWLFSKKERFSKVYDGEKLSLFKDFKNFVGDLGRSALGLVLILLAAQGIVHSAQYFSSSLGLPLGVVGILIVGVGSALPETYFVIMAARKVQTWMILGNLMGSIIIVSTLVLGIVALICPIQITNFSPYVIARFFSFLAAIMFFFCVRTHKEVTRREAVFLLLLYVIFVILEIYSQ